MNDPLPPLIPPPVEESPGASVPPAPRKRTFSGLRSRRTGKPLCAIGGGAWSNTWAAVLVWMQPEGILPPAAFVRRGGPLACQHDQAYVPVQIGDLILELDGYRPASADTASCRAWRVTGFRRPAPQASGAKYHDDVIHVVAEPTTPPDLSLLPFHVWQGANRYHNRDGSAFCRPKNGDVK